MRYELNSDEDKIIDIESIGDNGVLGLKDCCKIMNEQEAIINELEETIYQLIQKLLMISLKEHMTEEELKELMENCGL